MELFGINGAELLVITVVALLVLGPKAIIEALTVIKALIAKAKAFSARLREEAAAATPADLPDPQSALKDLQEIKAMTPTLQDLDPRALIRQAVREEVDEWMRLSSHGTHAVNSAQAPQATKPSEDIGQAQ
ncbi:MAG: hypothetical protein Q4G30_05890 [Actinomycetaceae bacterium]|nr:hypothetical protein [Actinomycetaceae bacterium]